MSTNLSLAAGVEPLPGYRLCRLRGRGAFGEVWETEVAGGPNVALKFMSFADGSVVPKEIRAIQMVRQLTHPNLIHIERVWSQTGYVVICMELAEGSLLDLLASYQTESGKPIPAEDACGYLLQAADALDFLNARQHLIDGQRIGIQHADVKPSNLLILGETVKLCDFGLATRTSSLIQLNRRQGTPGYSAPEVFLGQLSNQSDQYALAVSYYHLRTGNVPFPAIDSFRPSSARGRPAADLSVLQVEERPILARALSVVPQQRWPSCREFMSQMSAAVGGSRPVVPPLRTWLEDRRATPRYHLRPEVAYRVAMAANSQPLAATVRNVCRGGIGFWSPCPVDRGAALVVNLEGRGDTGRVLRARVYHCTPHDNDQWLVGCLLINKITPQELPTWAQETPEE